MPTHRRQFLQGLVATGIAPFACTTSRTRTPRAVTQVVPFAPHRDGAGVELRKILGGRALRMLDPFLMLDEFRSTDPNDYLAGFPKHPHRGFETVTIMISGTVEHRDSVGNHGLLGPGSLQWMTAGRGIVHAEMPLATHHEMWGFQLWVNLPARLKMTAPRYQDRAASDVPVVQTGDATTRLLAGTFGGKQGPVSDIAVRPELFDVSLPEPGLFVHDLPGTHASFVYVAEGQFSDNTTKNTISQGNLAVLGPGDQVRLQGQGRLLFAAGQPIGEPVARRGPFVMNTEEEIAQAYADYQSGRLVGG